MFQNPEEIVEEIEHQRHLFRSYHANLRITENQIAMFAESLVPIHLLRQRDSLINKETAVLETIQHLEQLRGLFSQDGKPEITIQFLFRSIPTGVIHLYSHSDLPMFKYRLRNVTKKPVSIVLSSWIEQFSYMHNDTIALDPGQSGTVGCLPTLKLDEVRDIYEIRKAVLHTRAISLVDGQESLLLDQSHDIQLLARDVVTWAILDEKHTYDLSYQILAWVTPNVPAIADMLRIAADYRSTKQLWGYQEGGNFQDRAAITRDQIRAIFQALKKKGNITYINSPISFGQKANEVQQRVNLPQYSLNHHQANCIDGAVLYASLIERAAMNPVIIIIPGHAFVGWETWENSGQYEFLETTMTGSGSFETAWKRGMEEFEDIKSTVGHPLFDPQGFAVLLNVRELREQGMVPVE